MKDHLKTFKPYGPYTVDFENMPGGKRITKEHAKGFWSSNQQLQNRVRHKRGVYIFGMKVAKGTIPCNVGKASNTIEAECFTERNLNIYNGEIIRYERNYSPFMFFLVSQHHKGQRVTDKIIRELETYVINLAAEKNPDLANSRSLEEEDRFVISDLGGGRGKGAPTREGKFFKKMMNY